MSRNYKKDLILNKKIFNLNLNNNILTFSKNNIKIDINLNNLIKAKMLEEENIYILKFEPIIENKYYKSILGTYRTIIKNYSIGLEKPFIKKLTVNGLGYKVELEGNNLKFFLNKSHPDLITIPNSIKCKLKNNISFELSSYDKSALGFFTSEIIKLRKYNPYTGFGILDSSKTYKRKKVRKVDEK